jgi:murein DD-endopeptidase MepM/ murein hydrolase activator NlpD
VGVSVADTTKVDVRDEDGNIVGTQLVDDSGNVVYDSRTSGAIQEVSAEFASYVSSIGNGVVTQEFDEPANYFGDGRTTHGGVDIGGAGHEGEDIPVFKGGTVVEVGRDSGDGTGWGNTAIVEDSEGNRWRYAHMESLTVSVGDTLQDGQSVGPLGSTGKSTGTHVHIEVKDANGNLIDPEVWAGEEKVELAKDRFDDDELAKGAILADMPLSQFENLSADEANKIINADIGNGPLLQKMKDVINDQLLTGDKVIDIQTLMEESSGWDDFSADQQKELMDYLEENGLSRDSGKWHFGDFEGKDPTF